MTTDSSLETVQQAPEHKKRKRGFTLTEIAIVLGIIGLILGAIWVAAAAVYNNLRVSHANTQILQIAQGVRALYATSTVTGVGNAMITDAVICAGAVPSDMVTAACGAGALNDPWPGGVTAVISNTVGDGFTIDMNAVPQAACTNLLVNVAGPSGDPGLYQATAATTAAPAVGDAVASGPRVANMTVANAAALCNNVRNIVKFGFALKS